MPKRSGTATKVFIYHRPDGACLAVTYGRSEDYEEYLRRERIPFKVYEADEAGLPKAGDAFDLGRIFVRAGKVEVVG